MTYEEYQERRKALAQLLQSEQERKRRIPLGPKHLDEIVKQSQVCRYIKKKMDELWAEYFY